MRINLSFLVLKDKVLCLELDLEEATVPEALRECQEWIDECINHGRPREIWIAAPRQFWMQFAQAKDIEIRMNVSDTIYKVEIRDAR
jgi:hypothetical protein